MDENTVLRKTCAFRLHSIWCYLSLALFLHLSPFSNAQYPVEWCNDSDKVKVFFVIPTQSQKIQWLENEISGMEESKKRRRLQKMLEQEEMRVDSFSRALTGAVEQHYNISPFRCVADTSISGIAKSPGHFFVFRTNTESGADALIIHDHHLEPLDRPFPYYVRLFAFSSFFDAYFGSATYKWRDLDVTVEKWVRKLKKYCHKQ